MIKAGIVGGTGYTGAELIRLLLQHPSAELRVVTSRGEAGKALASIFPNLRNHTSLTFSAPEIAELADCDVVFFATPNGTAMMEVPALLEAGVRVIDLAADFRLRDEHEWAQWYGIPHACPALLKQAVYGLPELHREQIRTASLVANPGCYPTAVQLGFAPLLSAGLADTRCLIADVKSGVSGAGRSAHVPNLHSEVEGSFRAYGAVGHRHHPEIVQGLRGLSSGQPVSLTFVPHLVPMVRGIEATLYASLSQDTDLQQLYESTWRDEPFVDVLPAGEHPETRSVRGTNLCRMAVFRQPGSPHAIISVVIDNLVKGAAGQAIQNMNIMFGLDEVLGLSTFSVLP